MRGLFPIVAVDPELCLQLVDLFLSVQQLQTQPLAVGELLPKEGHRLLGRQPAQLLRPEKFDFHFFCHRVPP